MKAPSKILLALTAAAAFCLAHPASANLITNPGFETGDFTGWFVTRWGVVGADYPHSGQYEAWFQTRGASAIYQFVNTTSSQTYTLSFWLANAGDSGEDFFQIVGNGTVVDTIFGSSPFAYTQFTYSLQGDWRTDRARLCF